MSSAREQIAEKVFDAMSWASLAGPRPDGTAPKWVGGNSFGENEARRTADAIIVALPGMVQPLEWVKAGDDRFTHDADYVDTTFTYQIQEGVFWYAAESDGHLCGSNSAAKAA
ncbi:hypothetical protein, partial [Sulfitobacter sp. HI0023]|uniref:hypothetical protein n=2 Tax=Sulfitobacter TaxID=60136 RepID=UPI000AC64281